MDSLRNIINQDIEERRLIREGIHRIKVRQTILILIATLIVFAFSLNYFELRKQIRQNIEIRQMLNDVIRAGRIVIEAQDEEIDSLITLDSTQHNK